MACIKVKYCKLSVILPVQALFRCRLFRVIIYYRKLHNKNLRDRHTLFGYATGCSSRSACKLWRCEAFEIRRTISVPRYYVGVCCRSMRRTAARDREGQIEGRYTVPFTGFRTLCNRKHYTVSFYLIFIIRTKSRLTM